MKDGIIYKAPTQDETSTYLAKVLDTEARPTNVAAGPKVMWWAWRLQMLQNMHGTVG